ncbi:hypothetical protein OpiT1DRAFT_03521 [Opitutaceae bacterium TAV1]|nr:hypothetical protein OpiT1DRAFT_03521 [Opitutaceae bacterium TAV1]
MKLSIALISARTILVGQNDFLCLFVAIRILLRGFRSQKPDKPRPAYFLGPRNFSPVMANSETT